MGTGDPTRVGLLAMGGLVVLAAVLVGIALWPTPQMGPDEEVFRTVDALYTAVRLRDADKVARCEKRLHAARDAGKLPGSAASRLDGVIAMARAGGWQAATERLYSFMKAQRRLP